MYKKLLLKIVAFLAVFSVLFLPLNTLLSRKSLWGAWNSTTKLAGFYNSPREEYDVLFFGSSNTYCSFNPLVLWEEKQVKSYVFATQNQPIWATYHYMKDAFKTQKPKVAVLDVLMMTKHTEYYDDGVNYSFADDMPFSWNKIQLALVSAQGKGAFDLLFNFTKYHSRWNELKEEDYTFRRGEQRDYLKGYVLLPDVYPDGIRPDVTEVTATAELLDKNVEYLEKIIRLCEEEQVELLLVKAPNNKTTAQEAHYREVEQLAREHGVPYVDYNNYYEEIGLDLKTDFYDKSHLNYRGAEKFTRFFAASLSLAPSEDHNHTAAQWDLDLQEYKQTISGLG
ncbi:MAG TPA: hypothetical protein IAB04_06050 [Candidatus Avimonoglobus intestinipullorum]|uniref:SGNH/GDSL hydrolase family protein n=1 Tax=Candidatus Avimonoglobus intestinipullorum TaxID=2840699 RepID=A0A9D1S719_9FIRM|nr:hypothetical protein [Candidatus Avimonoglobus intestinipullorum]